MSQRLDDGIMTQQRLGGVALQDEAAGPAVEVSGQQETCHWRLQVFLLILICVEWLLQVCWDTVCVMERRGQDFG